MKVDLTPRFFRIVPKREKIKLPISFRDDIELGADKPEEGATNSKTFYQATPPTGGYKPGDIWIDTDDNNHIYRADENLNWVSARDGKLVGLDDSGNLIKDVINSALETSTKRILGEFTFGDSGAIAIKTDANNGLWISPTGILAKKSGNTTFTIDNTGDATFAGTLSAPSGTLGTITAGTITGATIQTATSGARILLDTDKLVAYDDASNEILKVLVSGTDVGDVILGDYANNKGLKYDKSANAFYVKGNITITSGSGISNLSDAGSLATKDKVGKTDCDTTIISDGKIVTDLLTASNIQTGTLDASVVNVTNLNADNITTGTLTGRRIRTASSGQRIEIDKDNHWIRFYDSDGKEEGRINPTGSALEIKSGVAGSSISFRLSSSDGNFDLIPMELRQSGVATGLIYPMSLGAYDLGKSDKKWQHLYLSGNIYVDGNVDGVDISAHASNASAHHTKTQYLSEISINTDKNWGGYDITGVGKISASVLNIGASSTSNYISGGLYVSGGLDMEVSDITDVRYLYFNSSGGRIYYGGNLFQDFYNSPSGRPTGYTLNRETRFSTTLTPHSNCYEHIGWRSGWDGATTNRIWRVIHYGWAGTGGCSEGGVLACSPIRVENSALSVIKKVKKPKFFDKSKLTCKYGLKGSKPGKYFTEDDFPEEMKMKYPGRADGKSSIEVFRSIAILTQALKELMEKVGTLEEKLQ